jgi:hypothetical protein
MASFAYLTSMFSFQFQIELIVFEKTCFFDERNKHKHPTVEQLRGATVYEEPTSHSDIGITLLIGESGNGICDHLLDARWHNIEAFQNLSKANDIELYHDCKKLLPRGGYEAHRSGGSSGVTKVNKEFFNFIHQAGNFPRQGSGIKFIQRNTKWEALYIKTDSDEREAKFYPNYTQPQHGGSFKLPTAVLKQYSCLQEFMELKIYTALILQELNKTRAIPIQPAAVQDQLKQLEIARSKSDTYFEVLANVSDLNKYSKVAYSVGYHVDKFKKDGEGVYQPSLENKVCFINIQQWGTCGRGGAGPEQFVWALLDWRNT